MTEKRKHLVAGVTFNHHGRLSLFLHASTFAAMGVAFFAIDLFSDRGSFGPPLFCFATAVIMVILGLFDHRVTVLDDGLKVGHRFVPFSAITDITMKSGNHVRVSYTFQSASYRASLRTGAFSDVILSALAAELKAAAGLEARDEITPSAA